MNKLNYCAYEASKAWMYRNARPLDMARWQYHFEGGSKDSVLHALSAYQNDDGGFGYGLEPDLWNPNSTALQTWTALEILFEIDCPSEHPIIAGILTYLASGSSFDGKHWLCVTPSTNEYPHAPWWTYSDDSVANPGYNPTAALAGYILKHAAYNSSLFLKAKGIAQAAIDSFLQPSFSGSSMEVGCYSKLKRLITPIKHEFDNFETFDLKIHHEITKAITHDTDAWKTSYVTFPSAYIGSTKCPYYLENEAVVKAELDFIINSQNEDGTWSINWQWNDYPNEWAIAKNWWVGNIIVSNMKHIKSFGLIEL